jgi:PilZ domain
MTERRMARRYDLSLPVNVRLPIEKDDKETLDREAISHSGQTRDISTRGVYFTMQNELAPGAEVDFTLTLPPEITHGNEVLVRAHGRIVRVDKRDEEDLPSVGVAAVIERYDIIRGEGTLV